MSIVLLLVMVLVLSYHSVLIACSGRRRATCAYALAAGWSVVLSRQHAGAPFHVCSKSSPDCFCSSHKRVVCRVASLGYGQHAEGVACLRFSSMFALEALSLEFCSSLWLTQTGMAR
jgi:hypothetical protein